MKPDAMPDRPRDSGALPDMGDDYSYDLAHEVPDAVRHAGDVAPGQGVPGSTQAPPLDPDGDYSYDLAHEVPPQGG